MLSAIHISIYNRFISNLPLIKMKTAVAMPELKRIASSSPKSVGEVHSWSLDFADLSAIELQDLGKYHYNTHLIFNHPTL